MAKAKQKRRKTSEPSWQRYLQTPRRKYQEHKGHAKQRGVAFELTYDEWWEIWQKSGKYKRRGNRKGQFCMHRISDQGAYAVGNVYIGKVERNCAGSAAKNLNGTPHPDELARNLFSGEPGPDVPF